MRSAVILGETPMHNESFTSAAAPHSEPIVAVFDTKTMALRTVAELNAAQFGDIWLGVVRGEADTGETLVADERGESLLYHALVDRGTAAVQARRFDGILPPGSAVMSLRAPAKIEHAVRIIEISGGHIEL
jgi:hypothetical protein